MDMTTHLSVHRKGLALAVAATAALALPAGASASGTIDPAVYDSGVPANTVEHGVVDFSITGSPRPQHTKTEYWATSTRWRSVTTDASSGVRLREAYGDEKSSHYFNLAGDDPRVMDIHAPSPPPLAGWTPAYNKKLVDRGLLQAVGPVTIAGIQGTDYLVPDDRKSSDPSAGDDKWKTDDTSAKTEIALEDGTYAPLVRQTTTANGSYGTFRQREELTFRERVPATPETTSNLTRSALTRTARAWSAKVRAAKKAKKARHHRRSSHARRR